MKKLFTGSKDTQALDTEIAAVLEGLQNCTELDESYYNRLEVLDKLMELRNKQKRKFMSKENAPLIANLVGIAMILYHEKANVITTKAIGFVTKGRV